MSAALQLGDFNRLPAPDGPHHQRGRLWNAVSTRGDLDPIVAPEVLGNLTEISGAIENVIQRVTGFVEERIPGHGLDCERKTVNVYRHHVANVTHTVRPRDRPPARSRGSSHSTVERDPAPPCPCSLRC